MNTKFNLTRANRWCHTVHPSRVNLELSQSHLGLSRSVYLGNYYEYTRDFNSRSISLIQFAPCVLWYTKRYLLALEESGGGASVDFARVIRLVQITKT